MATTILSYKDRYVPVPESPVIGVGYMLFHEASENATTLEEKARFQKMTRDFQVRTIGVGCTDLGLDQLLRRDQEKEAEFLTFVNLVRARLLGFGRAIPPEYVNRVMAVYEPQWKNHPWPTPWLHKVLDLIEALIQSGRLPRADWLCHIRSGSLPSNRSRRRKR